MRSKLLGTVFAVLLLPGVVLAQNQSAVITGSVTDSKGEALPGVNVVIAELVLGSATDAEGNYTFEVPANRVRGQRVTLSAKFVGFAPYEERITLNPGIIERAITLGTDVLQLDDIIVTGVISGTPKKKLAFSVGEVDGAQIELAAPSNPVGALQGKVAGAQVVSGAGTPGSGFSVKLRGATSTFETSEPLYIVDGVILGSSQVDIDALNIENIEVVKGAAAASLYGSRASAGVVQITTKRGSDLSIGQTRIRFVNEYGTNTLSKSIPVAQNHELRINDNGDFLDTDGNVVPIEEAALDIQPGGQARIDAGADATQVTFQDNTYGSRQLYDNLDRFFTAGDFLSNTLTISQNSRTSNYLFSVGNYNEGGVIAFQDGYNRQNVRLNVDQRLANGLDFSASAYYARSDRDNPRRGDINPFYGLMFQRPIYDLTERDEDGFYLIQADPTTLEENPLYNIAYADIREDRQRFLGGLRARYAPTTYFDIEGNFSYDSSFRDDEEYYFKGFQTIDAATINDGRLIKGSNSDVAINGNVTASFNRVIGQMTTRAKARYAIESQHLESILARGDGFAVEGVKDLGVVDGEEIINSSVADIRAIGYYGIVGLDYADKYIVDGMVRRDGSSLFGPEERWQTYYRGSVAYRLSEEPFWPFGDAVNEFKIRGSYGTAGGRPRFTAQYETFDVSSGLVSKDQLGNRDLKPEFQTELELGIDFALFDRVSVEAVYATSVVENQLLRIPLAGYFGYGTQWQNAGTLESNTYEVSVDAALATGRDFSLNAGIVFDRTEQTITEFSRPPFRYGPGSAFYNREGETFGAMYGDRWITETGELPAGYDPSVFDVNDDGYLVPVGAGNSWTEGLNADGTVNLWGTLVDVDGDGVGDEAWGYPIKYVDPETNDTFVKIGEVVPDFSLGLSTTLRFKGLQAYMLWNAQVGGDIYNNTRQWPARELRATENDQADIPIQERKPIGYYSALYNVNAVNSHYVEDGTYVKLRELSIGYTFDRAMLSRYFGNVFNRIGLSVVGRNLLTITDYTGFDPEVGQSGIGTRTDGVDGDATLFRYDGFGYPNFRTLSGKVEIEF